MRIAELTAGPSWQTVDFISDLHLQASEPATFNAWRLYMLSAQAGARGSQPTRALFILGDLFEVWVGDDILHNSGFEYQCAQIIAQTALRLPVFFMHGNRDFLVGSALMAASQATLLHDPCVLTFNQQRWLLSHGDALCIADADYMHFRQQVRAPDWQQTFLSKPLAERQVIARGLRQQSQTSHDTRRVAGVSDADVDAYAAQALLLQARANTLIHGHTHRPADHNLSHGLQRVVLSDWDLAATPPRAEVLRLSNAGLQRITAV